MARFLLVRLSLIVVTLLAVSVAIFALIEAVPGDAASVMQGQQATPDSLRNLRAQMGLDRPPHIRYLDWIWDAMRGDLGQSAKSNASISEVMGGRLRQLRAAGGTRLHNRGAPRAGDGRVGRDTEPTPKWTGSSRWEGSSRSRYLSS